MQSRNIVIIGGTKGIGKAIADQLTKENIHLTIFSRNVDLNEDSDRIRFITKDILSDDLSEDEMPDIIDGLVYCPGSINLKPFKAISESLFMEDFRINALGAAKTIKAALKGLKKSTNVPGIVLFSTVAVGQGMAFHTSVAMAKGAVEGLTRSLAAELSPSIRINCIAPSLTQTPLAERLLSSPDRMEAAAQRHPLKRVGQAEDIATMACFLLSEHATWITGQIISVDGGMSAIRQ